MTMTVVGNHLIMRLPYRIVRGVKDLAVIEGLGPGFYPRWTSRRLTEQKKEQQCPKEVRHDLVDQL
jgi:hypothetical protein